MRADAARPATGWRRCCGRCGRATASRRRWSRYSRSSGSAWSPRASGCPPSGSWPSGSDQPGHAARGAEGAPGPGPGGEPARPLRRHVRTAARTERPRRGPSCGAAIGDGRRRGHAALPRGAGGGRGRAVRGARPVRRAEATRLRAALARDPGRAAGRLPPAATPCCTSPSPSCPAPPRSTAQYAAVRATVNDLLDCIPLLVRNLEHSQQQHAALVEAVLEGDADGAREVMREHCAGTAALLRGFLS